MNKIAHHNFKTNFLEAADRKAVSTDHVQAINNARKTLLDDFRGKFGREYFKRYFFSEEVLKIYSDYKYSGNGTNDDEEITALEPNTKKAFLAFAFPHVYFTNEFKLDSGSLHSVLNIPVFAATAMYHATGKKVYKDLAEDILDTAEELLQSAVYPGEKALSEDQIEQYLNALQKSALWMAEHTPPTGYRLATGELKPDSME